VNLPVATDYAPMEARTATELPIGAEWQYEPKWDGFRCLAFRDGDDVRLRSKSGQPLERYFPELVDALRALGARRFVLDGEIVIPRGEALSFDALLLRIHPAATRIRRLASETPARLLVFDLLVDERGTDFTKRELQERRSRLEAFATRYFRDPDRVALSPATRSDADAREWLAGRQGTDGVVAKRVTLPYMTGDRTGMVKIKRIRTADCVVGGFRYATRGAVVGSLLLGLYDDEGLLDHVGFTSSFAAAERATITAMVEKLAGGAGFTGRAPGGPSRWSTARSAEWVPLAPKLVVEVQYDHFTGGRFRHGTKLLRWRPEKKPAQCTFDQLTTVTPADARRPAGSSRTADARRPTTQTVKRRAKRSGPRSGTHHR
jgi:ATP-dependent DNA ligase